MELLGRIRGLLVFLRSGNPTLDDIMKFIALDTLFEFSVSSVQFNVVQPDGTVHIAAGFGFDSSLLSLVPVRLVSTDTLFNRYLRTGEIGECGSFDEYTFAGPDYPKKLFPDGFAASFAFPVSGLGAILTFCSKPVDLDVSSQEFLMIIGSILSFEIARVRNERFSDSLADSRDSAATLTLTPRQWKVLAGIRENKTNLEISEEMGYSESLVRQETVQIYRKLGVTGRKEIQNRPAEFEFDRADSL